MRGFTVYPNMIIAYTPLIILIQTKSLNSPNQVVDLFQSCSLSVYVCFLGEPGFW